MGDGAAESTSKGETGVQVNAGGLGGSDDGGGLLDDGIDLGRAGRGCLSSHCEGCDVRLDDGRLKD